MRQTSEARPLGAAELCKLSFPSGNDSRVSSTKFALNQVQSRARLRRQRHVESLHRLGPAPLFHFLNEIEAGADIREHLEIYAALDCGFIKNFGGDRFAPPLHVIDGGGQ